MTANQRFNHQTLEFWANVKLISQKVGYTERGTSQVKVPTLTEIAKAFDDLGLDLGKLIQSHKLTEFGTELVAYFEHRAYFLNNIVEPNLMDKDQAEQLFNALRSKHDPKCPLPMNKQKGDKKANAFFTGIVNMLIEANLPYNKCDFDPRSLASFTQNNFPIRSLSRRVDGAFPSIINPIAVWEIKEYYYTTTFGSRVADGVYETLLDGYELNEIRSHTNQNVRQYLMVDDYNTWWNMGRSYLCRICDMLHAGFLTEALFGKEVVERIPIIVRDWLNEPKS